MAEATAGPLLDRTVTEQAVTLGAVNSLSVTNLGGVSARGRDGVQYESGLASGSASARGISSLATVEGRGSNSGVAAHIAVAAKDALGLLFISGQSNRIADSDVVLVGRDADDHRIEIGGNALGGDAVRGVGIGGADDHLGGVQLIRDRHIMTIGVVMVHPRIGGVQRSTVVRVDVPGKTTGVIRGENTERNALLLEVVNASNTLCLGFCLGQCWKEHAGQNRDDRDHD